MICLIFVLNMFIFKGKLRAQKPLKEISEKKNQKGCLKRFLICVDCFPPSPKNTISVFKTFELEPTTLSSKREDSGYQHMYEQDQNIWPMSSDSWPSMPHPTRERNNHLLFEDPIESAKKTQRKSEILKLMEASTFDTEQKLRYISRNLHEELINAKFQK